MNRLSKALLVSLALCTTVMVAGCGHGATACAIVDVAAQTAEQACTVLKYLDADGTAKEVHVSRADLAALGRAKAAQKAIELPAGANPCAQAATAEKAKALR